MSEYEQDEDNIPEFLQKFIYHETYQYWFLNLFLTLNIAPRNNSF